MHARRAGSSTFGGLLVRGLAASSERGGAAVSARAARVLAHLLLDNPQGKQRVLAIPLEASPAAEGGPRLLMPRCLANLSQALLSDGVSKCMTIVSTVVACILLTLAGSTLAAGSPQAPQSRFSPPAPCRVCTLCGLYPSNGE